jgi:signal transduction histidine kinase
VIEAQEEERKRIARELHDEFAQALTALTINLQSTMQNLPGGLDSTRQHLAATQALTSQTPQEINRWILELRQAAGSSSRSNQRGAVKDVQQLLALKLGMKRRDVIV